MNALKTPLCLNVEASPCGTAMQHGMTKADFQRNPLF